jgi:chromosome segregation ATPase
MSTEPAADADEQTLQERVAELERENQALEARVDALTKKFQTLAKFLAGDDSIHAVESERGADEPNLLARLDQMEADIADIDDATQTAIGLATASPSSDHGQQTQVAKNLARNKLVKMKADVGPSYSTCEVSNGQIRDMAEPEHDLAWQIVDNAWSHLVDDWDCFEIDTSGDEKTLQLVSTPEKALVKAVERDLGRDDLAKSFFGEKLPKGRSERGV